MDGPRERELARPKFKINSARLAPFSLRSHLANGSLGTFVSLKLDGSLLLLGKPASVEEFDKFGQI